RPSPFVEGWYWHAVGITEGARGRPAAALDALGRMAALVVAPGPPRQVAVRPELVHGLVAAGRVADALAEASAVEALVDAYDVPLAAAASATALAAALTAHGDTGAALTHAERAVGLAEALRSPFLAA